MLSVHEICEIYCRNGVLYVNVAGKLDTYQVGVINKRIIEALATISEFDTTVLDIRNVTVMCAPGISLIKDLSETLGTDENVVVIVKKNSQAAKALALRLDQRILVYRRD